MEENFNIGEKIKELRIAKKISTKGLAKKAHITAGMISQLERGSTQGSVETLRKIAKVLDTNLASLFENKQTIKPNSYESLHIVRKNERRKISFPDPLYKCEMLTPDLQGDIEFVLVELEASRVTNDILPHTKGGEECDFVLSGTIEIQVGGLNYTLNEGDSIRFNPEVPHKIENKSDKKASYISAITPPSF
ncbi:MAG: cupin domain-containing protein [Epsilonproteobacteria bacterium]|nr:cupin domain-containing protein [Campylobacterota bacterium]